MDKTLFRNDALVISLLVMLILTLIIMAFSFVAFYVDRKRENRKLRMAYILAQALSLVFVGYLLYSIGNETPLIPFEVVLNLVYTVAAPFSFTVVLFALRKEKIYLYDAIAYILLLPCFAYLSELAYAIMVSVSLLYQLLRCFERAYSLLERSEATSIFYLAEKSLDLIDEGLFIEGKKKHDEYMNEEFEKQLLSLSINRYDGLDAVWGQLEKKGEPGVMKNASEAIIAIEGHHYLYRLSISEGSKDIVSYEVDEEMRVRSDIERNARALEKGNEALKKELESLGEIEHAKALSLLNAKVHDVLAQRLSLLQGLIGSYDEGKKKDIKPLKEDISSLLHDIEGGVTLSFEEQLDNLETSFRVIGFRFEIGKDVLSLSSLHDESFVSILREAATNAVRHAGAERLMVHLGKDGAILIEDERREKLNGLVESTGLSSIRTEAGRLGYYVDIPYEDGFRLELRKDPSARS